MQNLRQSTQVKVVIGPVVAVGDGFTPVINLDLTAADEAELLKHDSASVVDISGATFDPITDADGYYVLTLTTSHTDTLGMVTVLANDDSLCLPVKQTFMVMPAQVWDSLYGSDKLDVSVAEWLGAAAAPPTVAGVPEVDLTHVAGLTTGVSTMATRIDAAISSRATQASILSDATPFAGANIDAAISSRATVDGLWDEVLTGATHNVPASAGRRLRQLADLVVIHEGTAQAGANSSITLDSGASSSNDTYSLNYVTLTDGTGAGQTRVMAAYNGTTKVASVSRDWTVNPDSSTDFLISANANSEVLAAGVAQGGGASAITLKAASTATSGALVNGVIVIVTGTGAEQVRTITAYNESTKVATVDTAWGVQPDSTSVYMVWPAATISSTSGIASIVNAELVDVLTVDTFAEPGQGTPPATATFIQKLGYLYKAFRNKQTQTSDTWILHSDDGNTEDQKANVSDDGVTFTREEIQSGIS